MKGRIYVAGPMRGRERYNFPAFDAARDALEADGWEVVSPADIDRRYGFDPATLPADHDWNGMPEGMDYEVCMSRDLLALMTCDAIALLPGWNNSVGARRELHDAIAWNKEVIVL